MAHLTRYYMYKKIKEYFREPLNGRILGISGVENFYPLIDKSAHVINVQYPQVDMQNLPFEDNSFDFVISDQVIEHLEDPKKAIKESYRVLKSGGIAIHTTCFMNAIHNYPKDFWRFSTDALRHLCKDFSEILLCESWGNRIAVLFCFLGLRMLNIPERKCSLKRLIASWNEEYYPIVTWIISRK